MNSQIPSARDKLLFTPGPLTTSLPVKQAVLITPLIRPMIAEPGWDV
jgi:hypothetical protein